ncbi:MAG: hypothetical protein ACTHYM_01820 [Actinomycetaceae bacterium]
MSNSYGQDGWGRSPQQGDPWGQDPAGPGQQSPYGQSPADPGVPQYGQQGQPQYGAYAQSGQNQQFGQPGQPQYGAYAQPGQNQQYGRPGGLPAYQGQDDNPFAAPPAYGAMGGYGGAVERPGVLKAACIIMWIISGLALLGGIAFMALSPSDLGVSGPEDVFVTVGIVVIVMALLYAVLATFVWKGSNVARIILTVLLGLSLLGSLSTIGQGGTDAGGNVLGLVLLILVLVFMWQRSSSAFMKYRAATKH